ncbi:hypothetical protein OO184_10935 [Photorhabdus sp. APURE]|uniref:hypothetical protein n=1 Tax=Photorhabdus aballayi TaxID=2991723 RepID=UPI00223DE854|nr:hypothetical protein [Photorhabdus aballayi]MCW7548443.1 hypothetical protein [Photorhabdus aballayi]
MENTDNIIAIKFCDDSKPSINTTVTPKTSEQFRCKHSAITVNEQYRVLTCNRCGCNIDAFDFVLRCAYDGERVVREIDELLKQRDTLRSSCDKLAQEEKNAKARLRNAKSQVLFLENDIKKAKGGLDGS